MSAILFSSQRTLPELLHLMWALLPVKPLASGLTGQVFLILARFPPLSLRALFQGFCILTYIYLGLMGVSCRCRLLGVVGKNFPPCLWLPYFKAFGFSPSYLPWAHGALPSCRLLGLVSKNVCIFCFLCCYFYPNSSTSCRPLF